MKNMNLCGRHWLWSVLACVFVSCWVGSASASNAPEDAWRYTVTPIGVKQLKLDMPVYDEDGYDSWIDNGYVYITCDGQKETLFHYYSWNKSGDDPKVKFYKGVDGAMVMTRDRNFSSVNVTTSEKEETVPIISGTEYAIIHLTWTIPFKYRGKKITISWSIHKTGNGDSVTGEKNHHDIAVTSSEWNISPAPDLAIPEVLDPMLSYDANHIGTMMAFYTLPTTNIKSITGFWKEVNGSVYSDKSLELGKSNSGFAYLPADRCVKDLYVRAVYTDSEGEEQITESEPIDVPTLHQPQTMSTRLHDDGKVTITWNVNHALWSDISESDMWELQRNISENYQAMSNDWTTLGMVDYEEGVSEYSYVDSTLLRDYTGHDIYYRVRRISTSMWNWGPGSGYAMAMLPATLVLPTFASATVQRAGEWSELEHKVDVKFTLNGEYCNTEVVKDVMLPGSTTAVDYSLPKDSQGRYVLRNANDWSAFAKMVSKGNTNINAIMATDIDLGTGNFVMIGTSSEAYAGIFDGNGHTLSFAPKDTLSEEYTAPFRYVKGATIINLHTAGRLVSSRKFVAGIVACVQMTSWYSTTLENCRSSVRVCSTIKGDATNGGIIAHVQSNSGAVLHNCLFDGTFEGYGCYANGGMVGWGDSPVQIDRCLFAPTDITTETLGNGTFARMRNASNLIVTNSYYTTIYDGATTDESGRIIIRNNADWERFVKEVSDANGSKDVNAIMAADVSITQPVGSSATNKHYRGTFEGNGHTLTVNINRPGESFMAPFSVGGSFTIRNLNVQGTVRGGIHSAGLVGGTNNSTNNTIENCRVSTKVITNNHYAGGFIGHGRKGNNTIRNSLFDGSITAENYNVTSYCGAIIGWEDGGTSNKIQNCLENGTYTNFNHVGMNYVSNGSAYGNGGSNTNNWNNHDWGECNKVGSNSTNDMATKLGSQWRASGNNVMPIQNAIIVGYGIPAYDLTVAALDSLLGDQWTQMGSLVVPVMTTSSETEHKSVVWDDRAQMILDIEKTVEGEVAYIEQRKLLQEEYKKGEVEVNLVTSCVDHQFRLRMEKGDSKLPLLSDNASGILAIKTDQGDLARYEFNSNVELDNLTADTLQQGVALQWEVKSGSADYYRILRYDKLTPQKIDTLVTNYLQTAYIDQTAKVQHDYVYTVEGVTQCEGTHVSTATATGCRLPTGTVRGYVRLANGIGLPGVEVTATPGKGIKEGVAKTAITDESGFFEIDSLIYQITGQYTLDTGGVGRAQTITFNEDYNLFNNVVFYEETYYTFSGFVLYEGSSIPVSGVTFLRDGEPVINASGQKVTTTPQGAFELSVPAGTHRIQVVKEGHVFENGGYYVDFDKTSGDQRDHNWVKDISDIYFWDETRVTLQGRVVGGSDQGDLPLGKSLSQNNLGSNLTFVMQLEGDNTSWIVRDQKDATITHREVTYTHGRNDKDSTNVNFSRHRIEVHPDVETGEYQLPLYPVKYKITEIYAEGYPTLFQSGMVSETLDLTDYLDGDTATYSRIYHAPPTLDVWQFTGSNDDFYGIKRYVSKDIAGLSDTITLWRDGKYTMGYPVFMGGVSVPMLLSAREEYHYNNDPLGKLDIVKLHGGKVLVNNGLVSVDESEEVELDDDGQATYTFTPQNTTFLLEDDMALRKLKFTLLYDNVYYDVPQIEGYVMAAQAKSQGRRIIAGENTHLIDVLRDPPGTSSTAYIEKGSKLSYSYNADYSVTMGAEITIGMGKGSDYYLGSWVGTAASGTEAGTITSHDDIAELSWDAATTYYQDWEYNYEFTTNERIETSDNARKIGADADVYIGMSEDIIAEDAIAVRVVNSDALQRLMPSANGKTVVNGHEFDVLGTVKVLASGYDEEKDDSIYLVRDEVLSMRSKIKSTFAYSQTYIMDELIPNLLRMRNDLIMDKSTTDAYAQDVANKQKKTVYVSTVEADDVNFAQQGYYKPFYPTGSTDKTDEVLNLNNRLTTWAGFIAANEKEKLEVTSADLLKTYNFDGRTSVAYSESFATGESNHRYWAMPSTANLTGEDGIGKDGKKGEPDKEGEPLEMVYRVGGVYFSAKITPLFGFDFNYINGQDTTYTKETGFTLACSTRSNLSVSVYRTSMTKEEQDALIALGDEGLYYKNVEENLKRIHDGRPGSSNTTSYLNVNSVKKYRNFVFRTNGGATASPWEGQRITHFYNPGTVLDQPTMKINQLRIWAKEPSVSNVPFGEPARFTIYITNESEMPAFVTKELLYYSEDTMNPKGAKIIIDGAPLTGTGQNLWLEPNTIVEKQVEVYASSEYDYEDLGISIMDPDDVNDIHTVNLSAHFVPSAGKINISKPGDKWVVNTESAYDEKRQAYYLPVHIDGFDVNFRNFDHIELQYKLSTQGDKEWVNVCSYYRNSDEGRALMEQASGERKLMQSDGFIEANFYGEVDPIEQYYDLRAVTYCRYGNGYLTSSSNILTGIKDTRRPMPFGTPQPVNGILGLGDDIKISFSEPIAGNYLSPVNNFEVLGTTNQSNISLSTALHFNGDGIAQSQSQRNLSNKDFTLDLMMKPEKTNHNMTVVTHRSDGAQSMLLGVTKDWKLAAIVGDKEMQSTESVDFTEIRQVAYVFDVDEEKNNTKVTFYQGTKVIGSDSFDGMYNGSSELNFGYNTNYWMDDKQDTDDYSHFTGDMLEVRLWNKAMSAGELDKYAEKRLTGYELGLLDNYPMNEGKGKYAYDKAVGGNNLELRGGSTWRVPDGISLRLNGSEGVKLEDKHFAREAYEDYTLMCWFQSEQADGTLIANGPATDELSAKDHFCLGLEDGNIFFRSGGQEVKTLNFYNDGAWHHVAVTINRSRNVGNIYIDQRLNQTFSVDTLGGINGNNLYLGATYTDAYTPTNQLKGYIDEVAMYEMALPENILTSYSNLTPTGEEMGTLVYLPFSRSEVQTDNSQRLMPTGISLKRYKDNHGKLVERRDTIIAQDIIEQFADRTQYAPMRNIGKLENIKFSYVADGKDLLINLDVPDYQIEKTNVYITVKEVADLQGNLMASPLVMDLYAYRNPLRWNVKRTTVDAKYGEGATVEVAIENLSGKAQNYTLEGLPIWMTASQTSGKISALGEEPIVLTISPYINVGTFEEVIYIVGNDDMAEPLPITVRIHGEQPNWEIDDQLKAGNATMHMMARVIIDGEISHDKEDILVAIGKGHRIMGSAHIDVDQTTGANEGLAYLTIYGDAVSSEPMPLRFELYDASTGRIRVVEKQNMSLEQIGFIADTIYFQPNTILGSSTNPIILQSVWTEVQAVKLKKGWNWVSFYVVPEEATVSELLDGAATWEVGDGLEVLDANGAPHLLTYKSVYDRTTFTNQYYWDNGDKVVRLDPQQMYRFYSQSDKTVYLAGENFAYTGITVKHGWNRIGFVSNVNLPIATALSDYTDEAQDGDIIKSQSEFAVLNIDAGKNRVWKGTLKFLRTGEGYMLKRQADSEHTFWYPQYYANSKYNNVKGQMANLFRNTSGSSMNVIARVEGFDLQEGDRLVAYGGSETRGMVEASEDNLFFLSISKGEEKGIGFAIERDGEIVATAPMQLPYIDNDVRGTLDDPTAIRFIDLNTLEGDGWYTLSGIKLAEKPVQKGIYIHDGQKVTIK